MTDKDAGTAVPGPNELTDEERAYFESEGATDLPDTPDVSDAEQGDPPAPDGQARDESGKFVKTVPHQTFHMEREERKKAEARVAGLEGEIQSLREFRAKMEERQRWVEQKEQLAQRPVEPPDPEKDIFAYSKWQAERIAALEGKVTGREQQEAEQAKAREFENKVDTFWKQDVQAYAGQNPEFPDAAKWLAEFRDKQLQAHAAVDPRFADVKMRDWQINQELTQIIVAGAQQRRSPAEMVYELAKGYGFQGKQTPTGTPAMPDKLQRIQTHQEQSRSLAGAPARSGADEVTIDTLANMPQHEFNAFMETAEGQKQWKRLMGG